MTTAVRIAVEEISQGEADRLRDSLPLDLVQGFDEAFYEEKNDPVEAGRRWAFSRDRRTYLVAHLDGIAYLLVGINAWLNIASFARIVSAPKGHAADCMRGVIADWLVPRLRAADRIVAYVRTTTAGGRRVLAALQLDPPPGIASVTPGTAWALHRSLS